MMKKSGGNDNRQFMERIAADVETTGETNIMRQLFHQHDNINQPIRDLDGVLLKTSDDQTQSWKEHFEAISNIPFSEKIHCELDNISNGKKIAVFPSPAKIRYAIKKLKLSKVAGIDDVKSEPLMSYMKIGAGHAQST